MDNINVKKINDLVSKFNEERDWDQFHSIKNLSMALSVEASELVEIFQWLKESESNEVINDPELKSRVEEEISDIFIYLMRIAFKSGIDIESSVMKKIKLNSEKYPIEKAKGSAKKYSEL
ncbi:nucleotide pyrophosphohydrolase [Halobacteriovorax sp. XZX-3]|uniref:nucleotide pyrophosphohydrolase n=1 Tax=unclassified Halobacteriovorax TaxID=2639665 RepID=UPI003722374B